MINKEALEKLQAELVGFHEIPTHESAPPIDSQLVAISPGVRLESLEQFQKAPNRTTHSATLMSADSFCKYVNTYGDDSSVVYLSLEDGGSFEAVLDHHGKDDPSWCDHRASFKPRLSPEWTAWKAADGKKFSQVELAHFVEDVLDTFVAPEPNQMLKAALDFQSNESLVLAASQNLDNGNTKFTFSKENASGSVTFPHRAKISVPIHENEPAVELEVRLRYRTSSDGVLQFLVSFVHRVDLIQRDAVRALAKRIEQATAELTQFEGRFYAK